MKLHLGCGKRYFPGFTHVDIRSENTKAEIIDDVFKLEKFDNNTADLIYYCHGLEHVNFQGMPHALKRWREVLKPNGIVRVSVPDIAACCEHYNEHRDLKLLRAFFWGSQKFATYDYHYSGWDEKTLREELENAGFRDVRLWDWRNTEPHNEIDDYCRAYLPHMQFNTGKLMSLNMTGTK